MKPANNKYKAGNIAITLFDEYGSKIKSIPVKNYVHGKSKISKYEKKYPGRSGIMRMVTYNSKSSGKWDYG